MMYGWAGRLLSANYGNGPSTNWLTPDQVRLSGACFEKYREHLVLVYLDLGFQEHLVLSGTARANRGSTKKPAPPRSGDRHEAERVVSDFFDGFLHEGGTLLKYDTSKGRFRPWIATLFFRHCRDDFAEEATEVHDQKQAYAPWLTRFQQRVGREELAAVLAKGVVESVGIVLDEKEKQAWEARYLDGLEWLAVAERIGFAAESNSAKSNGASAKKASRLCEKAVQKIRAVWKNLLWHEAREHGLVFEYQREVDERLKELRRNDG